MFLKRKRSSDLSDEDLVLAVRDGQRAPLGLLWDRYAELLFAVGMKYLKDTDATQDEVVELFASLPEKLAQHTVQRFRPWVHVVMRNRCLLRLRGTRHLQPIEQDTAYEDEDDSLLHEATLAELEQALTELNADQRTCLQLFYWEKRSYERIAGATGLTVDQVRSHLQNGRRNLKNKLQHHADRNA